jgi:hypothetical protein
MIIASFPKGSFPENTWTVGTWPAAFIDTTDIQYTEVMEFSLAAILSAGFTVEMPVSAPFTLEMPTVIEIEVYEELSA